MEFTIKEQEELYNEVEKLFDLSDNIVNCLAESGSEETQRYYILIKPIVDELQKAAQMIADSIIRAARNEKVSLGQGRELENSIRQVFTKIENFVDKVEEAA